VRLHPFAQAADDAWLAAHLPGADVVLDCTDAFATRQRINRAARAAGVPLVSASALRWDGQISVFDPRDPSSPCYACLFPPEPAPEETRCALMGVFAPLVGQMGVMQAGEAIRLLAGLTGVDGSASGHRSLTGILQMVDGRDGSVTRLRVKRQPTCPVCGGDHPTVPTASA
jgi:molybdopterin/thiamine biosynthesis adenylyltransferase